MIRQAVTALMLSLIDAYKLFISPFIGTNCRFDPTCSSYALTVIREHGPFRGGWLAICRIARCHPWAKGGTDLPPKPHHH
ncbi:membrane protein insertion efficiency factor YidD [Gluconobacter kanchanaburiensis]|uniref:membrane protein insertion efficiency factor YidD n=1 Tax=Gluconobacter kanchanaburiensis TaxID=563199 RepID=UPI001D17C406|nr:membrane protein insertion efficiency factor YidD [Gluconobacter kanchanaburiensis]